MDDATGSVDGDEGADRQTESLGQRQRHAGMNPPFAQEDGADHALRTDFRQITLAEAMCRHESPKYAQGTATGDDRMPVLKGRDQVTERRPFVSLRRAILGVDERVQAVQSLRQVGAGRMIGKAMSVGMVRSPDS